MIYSFLSKTERELRLVYKAEAATILLNLQAISYNHTLQGSPSNHKFSCKDLIDIALKCFNNASTILVPTSFKQDDNILLQ